MFLLSKVVWNFEVRYFRSCCFLDKCLQTLMKNVPFILVQFVVLLLYCSCYPVCEFSTRFRQVLKPFLIIPGLCYFTGQRFVVGHSWTFSCPHTSWEQLGSKGGVCKICLISIRWLKQVLNSLIIWENPRHNWPVLCGKYTNPIIMSNEAMQQLMSDETLWGQKTF